MRIHQQFSLIGKKCMTVYFGHKIIYIEEAAIFQKKLGCHSSFGASVCFPAVAYE